FSQWQNMTSSQSATLYLEWRQEEPNEEGNIARVGGSSRSTGTPLHSTSTSTRRRSLLCQHHRSRCPPGLHRQRSLCRHHRSRCPPGLHRRLPRFVRKARVRGEPQSRTNRPSLWVTSWVRKSVPPNGG